MKKKIFIGFLAVLILAGTIGYVFCDPLCEKAGRFMAPQGDYRAQVAILEGTDYIRSGFVEKGMHLLANGKVDKIIVVIQRIAPAHRPFGINGNYADIVRQKLRKAGLKEDQFEIIAFPIRHPVTLTEAQYVSKRLEEEKISSAILVAPSFHARRSYMVYSHVGELKKIKIYPQASFTDFKQEKWWKDAGARRDFTTESIKLLYYLVCGHIPFKFSY